MALNSKTTIKLIDLICEGPIEGIQTRKGVFLNETVAVDKNVQREDFQERKGGLKQERLGGEDTVVIPQNVGVKVGDNYSEDLDSSGEVDKKNYNPGKVIQALTELDADYIELVFTVPKLYSTAVEGLARGQLFPARIKMSVELQSIGCGTGYVTVFEKIIEGISTSNYQFKTPRIDLNAELPGMIGPWNIKVRKHKFDDPEDAFEIKRESLEELPKKGTPLQQGRGDILEWSQILIHKAAKVNYGGTACAALSLDAEQFSSLPSRAYDVKGLKVKIPSNATPHEDGYLLFSSLPFDGQIQERKQWTTCPVCCFYDMITNKRYGAGEFIDADNVSWIDLINLSKYCNELVGPAGRKEPRFAINTVIGTQAAAYNVLQDLASVFRGMIFWKSNTVQIAADHGNLADSDGNRAPLDPVHIFTNSNVVNGSFSYSGSSLKTRSTRVVARYNDPENFYKPNYIIIEDKEAISKYGLQTREIVAFGCTSKTQAQRMAKWVMTSEELEGDTITFSVGLEGLNVLPGQIFAVSDAMRQGARLAGRIVGAHKNSIIADQNVSSLDGSNDQLTVVLPDGRVQVRPVTLDGTPIIQVSPDFDEPPADNAVWTITDTSLANQKFRCLSVAEGENGTYSITGVQHVDSIYDVVEGDQQDLDFPDTTLFGDRPATPEQLEIRFFDLTKNRNRFRGINISWSRGTDLRAISFLVEYKITNSGNFKSITTTNTTVDIDDSILAGQKVFVRVYAIGAEPKSSRSIPAKDEAIANPDNITDIIGGGVVENLPPDPEDLSFYPVGKDQFLLRWSPTANGQSLDEFVAVIRHSGKTDGSGTWDKSNLLRRVEARTTYAVLPMLEGEYLVKFENSQKLKSANATSIVIDLPDQLPLFNYESIQAGANDFPGIKDGVYYDDGYDGLVLDGDASFDDEISNLDSLTENVDSVFGTQRTSGTYYFAMGFDFGAKYSPQFKRILDSVGVYRATNFDSRLDLIDTWSDFDGDTADDTNVEIFLRTAVDSEGKIHGPEPEDDFIILEDNSQLLLEYGQAFENASNLFFGPWCTLENTSFTGRYFQFKAVLTTNHVDQTPVVESLGIDVKFETRTENSEIIESGLGTKNVTFDFPFYTDENTKASVGIIAYDMQPYDYFELSEPTSEGFSITFKGTFDGDQLIGRRFRYTAIGYGAKQP